MPDGIKHELVVPWYLRISRKLGWILAPQELVQREGEMFRQIGLRRGREIGILLTLKYIEPHLSEPKFKEFSDYFEYDQLKVKYGDSDAKRESETRNEEDAPT